MIDLQAILAYVLQQPPHRGDDVSKERVKLLLYLADWQSTQEHGDTLTPIRWHFNAAGICDGPSSMQILDAAKNCRHLGVVYTTNIYNTQVVRLRAAPNAPIPTLDAGQQHILDTVLEHAAPLSFGQLLNHANQTPPVLTANRYGALDLPACAHRATVPIPQAMRPA